MAERPAPTPVEPFEDDDTSGAVSFSRAVSTARELSGLPEPPKPREIAPSQTTPEPLRMGRVGLLFALMAGVAAAWWVAERFLP